MKLALVVLAFFAVVAVAFAADSGVRERLESDIESNSVIVFSKSYCPFCAKTKALMSRLEVPAKIVELDQQGAAGPEMQHILTEKFGQRTVPYVFIGGKLLGGNDKTQAAYQSGELGKLLSEAGVNYGKEL